MQKAHSFHDSLYTKVFTGMPNRLTLQYIVADKVHDTTSQLSYQKKEKEKENLRKEVF